MGAVGDVLVSGGIGRRWDDGYLGAVRGQRVLRDGEE